MDSHLRIKFLESQLRHTSQQLAILEKQHALLKAELAIVEKIKSNRMLTIDEQKKIWDTVCELAVKTANPLARELADYCRELFDPAVWMPADDFIALRKELAENHNE